MSDYERFDILIDEPGRQEIFARNLSQESAAIWVCEFNRESRRIESLARAIVVRSGVAEPVAV